MVHLSPFSGSRYCWVQKVHQLPGTCCLCSIQLCNRMLPDPALLWNGIVYILKVLKLSHDSKWNSQVYNSAVSTSGLWQNLKFFIFCASTKCLCLLYVYCVLVVVIKNKTKRYTFYTLLSHFYYLPAVCRGRQVLRDLRKPRAAGSFGGMLGEVWRREVKLIWGEQLQHRAMWVRTFPTFSFQHKPKL